MIAIRAENLTRVFEGRPAVDSLSLEVRSGEVLGFLGPNGAGKTTTVRMLCALIAPSSGVAEVAGHRAGRDDEKIRRSIGVLTESPGLYERLSAAKNLEIFAALHGLDGIPARIERYLRLFELWERRDDPAGALSKGMRQKLAIARALIHEPPILFLDEPTSGLDPEAAQGVRQVIEDLKGQGRTIWLCTHNLGEADRLCDRIAIFRTRLYALDTPASLRRRLFGVSVGVRLSEAPPDALLAALRALPGVQGVRSSGLTLEIDAAEPGETTPAIVRALVASGASVREVRETERPLEDVYLKLIHDAGSEVAP